MFNVLLTCTYTRKKNPNRMSLINRLIGNKALQNTIMLSCYSLYFTVHLENLLDVTEIPRIISIFSDEVNVCVFYSLYQLCNILPGSQMYCIITTSSRATYAVLQRVISYHKYIYINLNFARYSREEKISISSIINFNLINNEYVFKQRI